MERRTTAVIAGTVALVAGGTIAYQISKHEKPKSDAGNSVLRRATTVRADAETLHELWRNPETLQTLLGESVHVQAEGDRLRWVVPSANITWTTRSLEDRPGEVMRWSSASDDPVKMEATLWFQPAPADWGTEVHLEYRLATLASHRKTVELVGELFGNAMLRRMKSLAETGVIPTAH